MNKQKVIFIGKGGRVKIFNDPTINNARMRALALANLHHTSAHLTKDGWLVDASSYYKK